MSTFYSNDELRRLEELFINHIGAKWDFEIKKEEKVTNWRDRIENG